MTTDRNKLLELAKEAGAETFIDEISFTDQELERFAALLQAQGEPQSSDQVWNEAIEAFLDVVWKSVDHETASDISEKARSLKRPSQAQEPQQFAPCYVCGRPMDGLSEDDCHCFHRRELAQSVSGAVDELPPLPEFYDYVTLGNGDDFGYWTRGTVKKYARASIELSRAQATQPAQQIEFVDQWGCRHTLSLGAAAKELKSFYDAWPGGLEEINSALNTALKQPAQQAPAVSDETILAHLSRYWEHQWHDGDQHQIRISREQLVSGVRALLSQPAAAPVSGQSECMSHKQAWWAGYRAGKGLPADMPRQEALAAPSNQSQGGDK